MHMDCTVEDDDRLCLSSMSELVSIQSDSGRADPRTMITWPGAGVAEQTIRLTSTMVHLQTFTMNGFKWEMIVCQIPLSLPADVDVDRHKDCGMSANQSRRSKLSRLQKHPHTHNHFMAVFDFGQDYPGEPAPER